MRAYLGIEHDSQRRDALHATINSLPDPNYATLRALILVSYTLFSLIDIIFPPPPKFPAIQLLFG